MSLRDTYKNLLDERLQVLWGMRSARERTMILSAAAVIALALLHALLWEPATRGRARLQKELPQMRAQLVEMQALAQEAVALGGRRQSAMQSGGNVRAMLEASLAANGLKPGELRIIEQPLTVQVKLDNIEFSAWTDWLETVRNSHQIKPVEVSIRSSEKAGVVSLGATLKGPGA